MPACKRDGSKISMENIYFAFSIRKKKIIIKKKRSSRQCLEVK